MEILVEDTKNSNPNRCGMPSNRLLPQSSLGTIISNTYSSQSGHNWYRMRKYHQWNSMPYKERSLYKTFNDIQTHALSGGISKSIINDAKKMFKILNETKISRGNNIKGIKAACIYIACKKSNVPRSSKEIADMFNINVKVMTKGCKLFMENMNLSKTNTSFQVQSSIPQDYIERYCSNLGLSNEICELSKFIAMRTNNLTIVEDNTPPSIAAGTIFLVCTVCKIKKNKKEVSKACKISEVTISKCYKKLYKYRKFLFPKSKHAQYNIQ